MNRLEVLVMALGGVVSDVFKITKGNIGAVFSIIARIGFFKTFDFKQAYADFLVLAPAEREALEQKFDAALEISDPVVQKKIADSADALNDTFSVVVEAEKVFEDAKAVVAKMRAVLGV